MFVVLDANHFSELDALLLTRNLVDFEKVPRLKVENWLD